MLTRIRNTFRQLRRDERGNLTVSLAYVILGSVLTVLFIGTVNVSLGASQDSKAAAAMNTAVDDRFTDYVTELNTGKPGLEGERCYDTTRSCVTLSTSQAGPGEKAAINLEASYRNGQRTMKQTRFLTEQGGTHIVGFDTTGQAVWGTVAPTVGTRFTTIATSDTRSCGLDTAGAAWCWGADTVGDGTTEARIAPTKTVGTQVYTSLTVTSTGAACATDNTNKTWCWGPNPGNRLGTGDTAPVLTQPTLVPTPAQLNQLQSQGGTVCGLDTTGQLFCWAEPVIAPAPQTPAPAITTPTAEVTDARFATFTPGDNSVCGITADGQVFCRGDVAGTPVPAMTVVSGGLKLHGLTLTAAGMCALEDNGQLWCAGPISGAAPATEGVFKKLGHVPPLQSFTGQTAITTDGKLLGVDAATAAELAPGNTFTSVASAAGIHCAIDNRRAAWCWGDNAGGQLGVGSTDATVTAPTKVATALRFSALYPAPGRVHGLDQRGNLHSWGQNPVGQLGNNTVATALTPVAAVVPATPVAVKSFTAFGN